MTEKQDETFDANSAYGSHKWVAATLGRSADWLYDKRAVLERQGFPKKDELTGHYLKADVLAWIAARRTIPDPTQKRVTVGVPLTQGANLNGI